VGGKEVPNERKKTWVKLKTCGGWKVKRKVREMRGKTAVLRRTGLEKKKKVGERKLTENAGSNPKEGCSVGMEKYEKGGRPFGISLPPPMKERPEKKKRTEQERCSWF